MEWLIILALAVWIWRQDRRMNALTQRLAALELRNLEPAPAPAPGEDDVLVLDTPLPVASNDEAFEPGPAAAQADLHTFPQSPPNQDEPLLLTEALAPLQQAPRQAPPPRQRERKLEQWLAENGLAWLGGGAFALGGAMLVALAVQQSWFTPMVRIYCALALSVVLIGAGEFVRRRPDAHLLAAGLLAGAGVATLYATAWGAHALYNYIDAAAATVALAACALVLLGLSFRHGQPLAMAAILAAFLAPVLTAPQDWATLTLTMYLGAVAAAGFAVAAMRRWSWAGVAALLGLYFWFAAAIGAENVRRALTLASFASLGGAALAFRKPSAQDGESGALPWVRAHTLAPTIAICLSSIALIWIWLAVAAAPDGVVSGPAWVGAMFVALAAAAARARVAPAAVVGVAVAALVGGFMAYLATRFQPIEPAFYPFILFAAAVVLASAIGARPHRRDRTLIAVAGGVGAALLTTLGAFAAEEWHGPMAYAPLFLGAAALFGAAWLTAGDVAEPKANAAVDVWVCAAAALTLIGVESLFVADLRSAAHASLALSFAAASVWRGWRGLSWSAMGATALAMAQAFSPDLAGASLAGASALWRTLAVLGLATGFLFGGAYVCLRRAAPSYIGESLSAAAIVLLLLGAYLTLHWLAVGGAGAPLDRFTETALRALTLLGAGHIAMARAGQIVGPIGAVRGHALMASGFVYALLINGMALNPWWGSQPAPMPGPVLFNSMALAFAAPALLMSLGAHRLYRRQPIAARLYAGAGALMALIWAVLEVRHGFCGVDMTGAAVGVLEGATYGLVFIAAALIVAQLARWRQGALGADLRVVRQGAAWAGLILGGWLLLVAQQVWWSSTHDALSGGLLALALVAAMALALVLGRLLSVSAAVDPARFAAAAAAVLFAWSGGHTAIRAALAGGGLENLLHALWPLALVLAGASLTARAPGRDTIRPYLFDLQAIWANAAWPATAMAALGLWLAFNPWWGETAAPARTPAASITAIALAAAAAWMSLHAGRVPHLRRADWFAPVARVAAAAHLLVALTMSVRAAFQRGVIAPGMAEGGELWSLSAAWALYGAGVLALGAVRRDGVLRWCGLAVLFATAAKVFVLDTAQLSGMIRAASVLGLAAVATLTALGMRRLRSRQS